MPVQTDRSAKVVLCAATVEETTAKSLHPVPLHLSTTKPVSDDVVLVQVRLILVVPSLAACRFEGACTVVEATALLLKTLQLPDFMVFS